MTRSGAAPVRLRDLTRRYERDRAALDGVSVDIEPGKTLGVLGPSGCGKSTLLRLIAGVELPDEGTVTVAGHLLSSPGNAVPPERRRVNMVFQDYALWPHLTVRDIIGYGLRVGTNRTSARARASRVDELMALLHLEGLENRRPAEISGGQQQRVAIARALATSPDLLLFDEPLSNLDSQLRSEMREELALLLGSLGTTAVYVTHDVTEALALADHILVLHEGRAVQHDTPRGVFTRPRSGWVAGLAGFSSVVELDRAEATADGLVRGAVGAVEIAGRDCGRDRYASSDVPAAYVHPDAVRLVEPEGEGAATVVSSVFEGRSHRTRVDLGRGRTVVTTTAREHAVGERIDVSIDPDAVVVFGAGTESGGADGGVGPDVRDVVA